MVAVTALTRKMRGDIRASKWQFTAIILLSVIGLMFFMGLYSSFQNLWSSVDGPYEDLGFADFTVKVYSAPTGAVDGVRNIAGVKAAVGRINVELPITMPDMENQFLTGRIITLPDSGRPAVDDVLVVEGAYFSPEATDEVLVEKFFADIHSLKPGDSVSVLSNNREYSFVVKGIVVSPEYLWPAKNIKDHMPTVLRTWGVLFMPENEARNTFNASGINEFTVTTTDQGVRDDAIKNVVSLLRPYSVLEVTPREDQASDTILHQMIGTLDVLAVVISSFFLLVAGVSTYVLLTRMINAQGTQIGTMRALGYGKGSIVLYYLSFSFVIWAISAVGGVLLGQTFTYYLTNLFASRISLPIVIVDFRLAIFGFGAALTLTFLTVAAAVPAWAAANLNPAIAMRPLTPKFEKIIKVESALFFLPSIPSSLKSSLRNLSRSRKRSISMVLGIVLATSLLVSTSSFLDSFDNVFNFMYNDVAVYDLQVSFITPQPMSLVAASEAISGVKTVEPIIQIPYHLQNQGKESSVILTGLGSNSTLLRLYSPSGARRTVDPEGLLLSKQISDKLNAELNTSLTLHFLNSTTLVKFVGFIKSPYPNSVYLSLEKAQEVVGVRGAINGLLVSVDPGSKEVVKQELFKLPSVSGIETTSQQRQDNLEMLKVFNIFIWLIFFLGVIMAFAVVFNSVSLSINERMREFATMRTIGVSMRRIAAMVTLEDTLLGSVGVAIGLPAGHYLAGYFFSFFTSELFEFEAVTYASTYVLAVVTVFVIILVSSVPALIQIKRLNLAKVVKEQVR
jgi:putative ABC transport system permease protein